MKNPWLWESLAVAPPAAFDITCNSVGVRASLTDTFGVNLVARYTQSVLGFTGEDSVNFFPPAPEPLQSTQTDKQFFARGEAVPGKTTGSDGLRHGRAGGQRVPYPSDKGRIKLCEFLWRHSAPFAA